MKTIKLTPIKTIKGDNLLNPDGKELNIKEFVDFFLFGIPAQALTLEDSVKAQMYFMEAGKQNGHSLKLEDDIYNWVKAKIEKYAHLAAGLNAVKVKEAWEDLEEEAK